MNQLSTSPALSIVRKLVDTIWIIVLTIVFVPNAMAQNERVDVNNYLTKLDVNRNELLEPDEINDNAKRFLRNMEFDTDRPIPIKRILRKFGKTKDEGSEKDKTPVTNSSTRVTKVPSFGPSEGGRPVAGFGLSDVKPATARFSESVLQQVEKTLGNYDLNKDRILDRSEIKRAPWGKPKPSKSDTNRDGKLNHTELANRYFAREQFSRESEKTNRTRESKRQAVPVTSSRTNSGRSNRNNRSSTRGQVTRNRNKPRSQFKPRNSAANDTSAEARKKYAAYAKSLIKNYDKDGDGNLSQAEVKSMRRPPVGADGDGNGYVTETELVDSLSGVSRSKAVATKSQNPKSNSNSPPNNRSTNSGARTKTVRASGSFSGLDKNGDNQVEMHEFASEWDDQKADEFFKKDKNRDGVITSREWNSQ
jgi:Ca2+-binding EF-hand superfamily protein